MKIITKRIALYVLGLFLLSLGVSFSIQAGLGVSPVSSLAYAISLSAGLTIGITTILANILFIIIQAILNKRIDLREFGVQFLIVFLFGFFMDATLIIVKMIPAPETLLSRLAFLGVSFYIISAGLLFYLSAKLTLMPYDALTYVISNRFKMKFSKAKISSDLLNVGVAGAVCLIFIQSFGSIGIGTIAAAYFIGKILGRLMQHFHDSLQKWIFRNKNDLTVEDKEVFQPMKLES